MARAMLTSMTPRRPDSRRLRPLSRRSGNAALRRLLTKSSLMTAHGLRPGSLNQPGRPTKSPCPDLRQRRFTVRQTQPPPLAAGVRQRNGRESAASRFVNAAWVKSPGAGYASTGCRGSFAFCPGGSAPAGCFKHSMRHKTTPSVTRALSAPPADSAAQTGIWMLSGIRPGKRFV